MMERENPGWRPYRTWRPVRFSHGPDGFIRGCPGSPRDLAIRQRSRWFEMVERHDELGWYRPAFRPTGKEHCDE